MPNFVNPFYADLMKERIKVTPDTQQIDRESARKQIVGEEGERILREYAEKEKQEIGQGVKTEAEYSVPALKHIYVPQYEYAPRESEPDWKEKARRVKIRTKNREKGRKTLTPHATSLTLPIFKYETRKRSAVKDIPPDQLAEMKKTLFNKQWHSYKFDKEYLGRHYAEVRDEMEELRTFLDAFGAGDGLDAEEKEQISSLRDLYTVMDNTISAFIAMHCIVRADEDGHTVFRVSQAPPDEAAEDRYNQQKDTLRRYIGGRSAEAEMERLFSARRDCDWGSRDNQSSAMINSNDVNFELVSDFLNLLNQQRYKTNYQQNKELIDPMVTDLKRVAELWDYARQEISVWGLIISDLKQQGADENDQKIAYARSRMERIHPRLRAFHRRTDGLMRTVNYLMKGTLMKKDPLPGSEVWGLLDSYRRALPGKEGEKKKPEKVDVKCCVTHLNDKRRLFDEAWKRYAAKPENKAMKEKLLGDEQKMAALKEAAVLMNSEDNVYNDRVLALMIRLEELKEQDDDYRNSEEGKKEIAAAGRETELVIAPKLWSIIHYRIGDYRSFTKDELISKQKEIYELTNGIKICVSLGLVQSDVPGLNVWEKILNKPVPTGKDEEDEPSLQMQEYDARDCVLDYKIKVLRALRKRIRATVMLSGEAMAYADGSLEQILNENELERFKLKTRAEQGNTTAKEKLYRFAWDRMLLAATNIDGCERAIGHGFANRGMFNCLKNVESMTVQDADKQLSAEERRTHYDSIAMRYEHLEKKYGYEIPDFFWILLHWDEMFADAESIKGNLSLIEKDKEVLKEDDRKDVRLLHLARYYDHYMEAALGILQQGLWSDEITESQFEAIRINIAEYMAEVSQDREYLMTVPPGDGMAVPEEVPHTGA